MNDRSHETLEIKEAYDFEKEDADYAGVTGTAVQKIYEVQEAGVLAPFDPTWYPDFNEDSLNEKNSTKN